MTGSASLTDAQAAIADAAITVIAERGFDVVSVRSAAAAAGMSPGAVQYHFPSRQRLLQAAFQRSVQRQDARVLAADRDVSSKRSPLRELLPIGPEQREDALAWVAFGAAASTRPWLAELYRRELDSFREKLEEAFASGVESGELRADLDVSLAARLVTALVNGLTLDYINSPGTEPAELDAMLESGLVRILA
ncbi:TetR/AcrR family transcriptional regulator [Brevibacterium sp. Marseille-P9724]|uniref:TetR/AcrR family transcriptional regulator n=1 Tax=Brevibacterium sp. Marseille-P9724 TaxID=2614125 RepID=UPI001D033839|nr:TetR family transcriptional regulator C-terminal domain-containing protein [Brevibacterium sp. Marseille-P9724]